MDDLDALAGALRRFTRVAVPLEGRRAAAVAIAISDGDDRPGGAGGPDFLLTRRAPRLRAHAGQFALPGGGLDAGEDAVDAALRELREEVGATADRSACLGVLDDYPTRSGYVITPVVVRLGPGQRLAANPAEVAELHRIPLTDLDVTPRFLTIPESDRPVIQLPLIGHSGARPHGSRALPVQRAGPAWPRDPRRPPGTARLRLALTVKSKTPRSRPYPSAAG